MKKTLVKTINFLLALMMVITSVSVMTPTVSAANYTCTMTLEELENMFKDGRYWNHIGVSNWDITTTTDKPCTSVHKHGNCKYNGSCGCNSFKGYCIQCMGFAYALQYLAFDKFDGYSSSENWDYTNAMANLKPGDVIRLWVGSVKHSIFVTKIDGDTIYYMDCNGTGGGCIIRHNQTITKTALKSKFVYVSHSPVELVSNADNVNRVNLFETAIVTARSGLTIREQPDINSAKVGYLSSNESVRVCRYPLTDSSGYTWRYLLDERGWVCSDYLNITSGQIIVSGNYKIQCENGKYITYTSSPKNGVNIVMYDDLSNTELASQQIWNFEPLFYFGDCGFIIYKITPVLNSKFALDSDTKNNENVSLWESHNGANQQWIMEIRSDGSLRFNNNGTRWVLDVRNGSTENNAEVITYTSHDGDNQKFYLINP